MWLIPPFIEANSDNPGWGNTIEDCKGGILSGNVEVLERDNTIISWPPRFAKVCHDLLLLPAQSRSHILWKKSDSGITFWTPSQPLSPIYVFMFIQSDVKLEIMNYAQKAGLPESVEDLTKSITRGFIVELLNVVIINPIIQVGTSLRINLSLVDVKIRFLKSQISHHWVMSPTFRFRRRPHWGTGIGDEWDTKSVSRF